MSTLATYLFATLLFACAMLLIWHHRKAWESIQAGAKDEVELEFQRRRYSRRMRTGGIIIVVAIAIPLYRYITSPLAAKFYLAGMTAAIIAMLGMAIVDMFATRKHYDYQRRTVEESRLELVNEVKRLKQQQREKAASESTSAGEKVSPSEEQ